MLGRLEMDVDACIAIYRQFVDAVSPSAKLSSKLDSTNLRTAIEKALPTDGEHKLNDGSPRKCEV